MATTPSPTADIATFEYEVLKAELEKRKGDRVTHLVHAISDMEVKLEELKEELALLDGKPKPKIKIKNLAKVGKPSKKKTKGGKRGNVSEQILAFLTKAGKKGAHVSDIASHLKTKAANVTAFMYTTGKKKGVKKVSPATFSYTP